MGRIVAVLHRLPLRALTAGVLLLGAVPLLSGSGDASESARRPAAAAVPAANVVPAGEAADIGWLDRLDLNRLRRAAAGRRPASSGVPSAVVPPGIGRNGAPRPATSLPSVGGIPPVVLAAYRSAAAAQAGTDPNCHLGWPVLAGIGQVESHHAAGGGSGRAGWNGNAAPRILGPVLDGTAGSAAIRDSDGGRLDGDLRWDRAVGPMQFLPSTWRFDGRDGNGDGRADPENIADAALAAAGYLCAGSGDLRDHASLAGAVFSYNHSLDYVRTVLGFAAAYARGTGVFLGLPAAPPGSGSSSRLTPRPTPDRTAAAPTAPPSAQSPTPRPSPTSPAPTGSPTASPSPSPTSGPAWTAVLHPGGRPVPVRPVDTVHGLPGLPPADELGWWRASAIPGQAGTTLLVAPAGSAAHPGRLDPKSLPIKTLVVLRTRVGPVQYRVVGYSTATALPPVPAPHGRRQLLLLSYARDSATDRPALTIVWATPA